MARAYREGSADGIMGRDYHNPYGFTEIRKMWSYFNGYMRGLELMAMQGTR